MTKVFTYISKVIGWTAIILWGLLSLLVLFFLVDRRKHPHMKSISDRDLKDYLKISMWLIGVFGVARALIYLLNGRQKKHCP